MKILIIGSGGREHAIAQKLEGHDLSYMGTHANPGLDDLGKNLGTFDLVSFQTKVKEFDLVCVGPEKPLADGVADIALENGVPCIGPSKKASEIEWSKSRLRHLMRGHYIPGLIEYQVIEKSRDNWLEETVKFLKKGPYVVKADGLCGGKGVKVFGDHLHNMDEALEYIESLGKRFVLERRELGREFSLMSFCDGKTLKHMPLVQDFKRLKEFNQGLNTGGMGSVLQKDGLLPGITLEDRKFAESINEKVIEALNDEDILYQGILYGSFMKTDEGIKVIEYNSRFGDPEVINIMEVLETDLTDIFVAICNQTLDQQEIRYLEQDVVCKYLVPPGYPDNPKKNFSLNLTGGEYIYGSIMRTDECYQGLGSRTVAIVRETGEEVNEKMEEIVAINPDLELQYRPDIGVEYVYQRKKKTTYQDAGVDIQEGNRLVSNLKEFLPVGGFGGTFKLGDKYLISSIDGVGTKTDVALKLGQVSNLGYDIVNHSINDILVQDAQPLFFLDYLGTSNLNADLMLQIVRSMHKACTERGVALLGGETAEMPGIYRQDQVDIVGCIVGIADHVWENRVEEGDMIIGFPSSGLHTNGFSLVRKVFTDQEIEEHAEELLAPHTCYLDQVKQIQREGIDIKGMSHITGGGFYDNLERVLPDNLTAVIRKKSWTPLPIFKKIQDKSGLEDEMYRVFNMGIGFCIIINMEDLAAVSSLTDCVPIGYLQSKTDSNSVKLI